MTSEIPFDFSRRPRNFCCSEDHADLWAVAVPCTPCLIGMKGYGRVVHCLQPAQADFWH